MEPRTASVVITEAILSGVFPEEGTFLDVTPEFYTALNRPSTPLDDLPFKRE
jgi:hypothetical protein